MATLAGMSASFCSRRVPRRYTMTASVAASVPWPDLRLWVNQLPDGTCAVVRNRSRDAVIAFDAYSRCLPGTREVELGDASFFAFTTPRLGAEQLVVWRRIRDVRERGERWQADIREAGSFESTVPLRVNQASQHGQLTAAVWRWEQLDTRDPKRFWDDGVGGGPWMYWESFWVPTEDATCASESPAFSDVAGKMLAPTLTADATASSFGQKVSERMVSASVAVPADRRDEHVVASTATATAVKDRAYAIVYQYNVWGSDVSRSGTGSDLWSPEARLAVTALEAVVDHFGVRSMLDCACGDATWMVPYFVSRRPEIDYCGCDIVHDVIQQNRRRHPGVKFLQVDAAESPLPVGADLIFSKETLNHMSLQDAQSALRRFVATGARYLLTNVHEGSDNYMGQNKTCFTTYIKYDYELPPFNMKKIASVIEYQGVRTSYSVFALTVQ